MEEEKKEQKAQVKKTLTSLLVIALLVAAFFDVRLFMRNRELEADNLRLKAEAETCVEVAEQIVKQYEALAEEVSKVAQRSADLELERQEQLAELEKLVEETVQKVDGYIGYGELGSIPSEIKNRVVGIKGKTSEGFYEASAFSMFEHGLYVTCYHCINGEELKLIDSGKSYNVEVLAVDKDHDIALIRSEKKKSNFSGTNHSPEKNSLYFNANFLNNSLHGYYTTMLYEGDVFGGTVNLIMPTFPGGSGSPVVDTNGNVVAVLSRAANSTDGKTILKIGVPIKFAEDLYEEYKKSSLE